MGERRPSGHGGWRFAQRVGGRGGVVGGWGGGLFVARVDVVHVVLVMDVRRMSGGSAGWGGSGEGKGWPRGGGVGGGCCRPYSCEEHSFVVLSCRTGSTRSARPGPLESGMSPGTRRGGGAVAYHAAGCRVWHRAGSGGGWSPAAERSCQRVGTTGACGGHPQWRGAPTELPPPPQPNPPPPTTAA